MTKEELHDAVDIEMIEPESVRITENWEEAEAGAKPAPPRLYTVTYSLPIRVSKTWQYMFQRPDEMSGVAHLVNFEFSEDARHVHTTLESEPSPELILVLRKYADRANKRWEEHRNTMV